MKNLTQWNPFAEFDRFMGNAQAFPRIGQDLAADLYEQKGSVVAKFSISGIDASDLEISIEDDVLTVTGSREEECEIEEKDYYSKEIRRGSFSRSLVLPSPVEAAKATAAYAAGVLTVRMPVVAGRKKRAVQVEII